MAISSIDASGILVRGPQARGPSKGERGPRPRGRRRWALLAGALAVVAGAAAGAWSLRGGGEGGGAPAAAAIAAPPAPDCASAEAQVAAVEAKLAAATRTIDELRARDRALAAEAAAATAARDKLAGVVGARGEVSQRGDEITLELVDKVLFRVGEAELTPRGAEVLAQVGAALNDVPDKQNLGAGPHRRHADARRPRRAAALRVELGAGQRAGADRRPLPAGSGQGRSAAAGRGGVRAVPARGAAEGQEPPHRDRPVPDAPAGAVAPRAAR
jgi:hypothetical protein